MHCAKWYMASHFSWHTRSSSDLLVFILDGDTLGPCTTPYNTHHIAPVATLRPRLFTLWSKRHNSITSALSFTSLDFHAKKCHYVDQLLRLFSEPSYVGAVLTVASNASLCIKQSTARASGRWVVQSIRAQSLITQKMRDFFTSFLHSQCRLLRHPITDLENLRSL
jgi:hypothetical protein